MTDKLTKTVTPSGTPAYYQTDVDELIATLEQRLEGLEGEGHSMDCDVRKDSISPPDCSCGWVERMAALALTEDSESPAYAPRLEAMMQASHNLPFGFRVSFWRDVDKALAAEEEA